ncbi:amidohydrolase 3 [Hyaloraphidium curvatum]|nr:amidohydrolase 3 [Hyaloraphidium curvatum]
MSAPKLLRRSTTASSSCCSPLPLQAHEHDHGAAHGGHASEEVLDGPPDAIPEGTVRVFVAKKIVTVAPGPGVAEAVAVGSNGRILAVGSREDVLAFAEAKAAKGAVEVDETFKDKVLLPGFVEAHGHCNEAINATLVNVGYFPSPKVNGDMSEPVKSYDDMVRVLRAEDAAMKARGAPDDEVMIAVNFDPIYFVGQLRLSKEHLDRVSTTRPIAVRHASGHVLTANSLLLKLSGITRDSDTEGIDKLPDGEPSGELQEGAQLLVKVAITKVLQLSVGTAALENQARLARNAGVTTTTELGGLLLFKPEMAKAWAETAAKPAFPARFAVYNIAFFPGLGDGAPDYAGKAETLKGLQALCHDKLRMPGAKLLIDGSIQGFTAVLRPPGYFKPPSGDPDHQGISNYESLEDFVAALEPFHEAGFNVHVHCNGDGAVDVLLDAVEIVNTKHPRSDHRHVCTHSQLTRQDQYLRMASLGVSANIFANHIYYWGDQHRDITVGPERAARMNACRTALASGVRCPSIHSDSGVTPIGHLHTMWCAVNRLTASGEVLGEGERITAEEALRMATVNAAWQLKMDRDVGSIECGKMGDFAVLEESPLDVDPAKIKDIKVWGTVVGGLKHPSSLTLRAGTI